MQLNGNQISIQDANGNFNKEGTFQRTSFDDLSASGNAFFNEMSVRREPSLHAIEVFAVRSVTDSVGGAVLGKAIGAGVEAIQGARAASAAAAETTELVTQAATTVGNKGQLRPARQLHASGRAMGRSRCPPDLWPDRGSRWEN